MSVSLYLFPFIISFLISVLLTGGLVWLSHKFPALKKEKAIRLGGIALILSFAAAVFLNQRLIISQPLWGILIASGAILFIGLWDDWRQLNWKTQLFFQIAAAVFVFILGVRVECITNPLGGMFFLNVGKYLLPSLFFTIAWIVILMNATNWLDGLDGLSGGVTLFCAFTLFFLSLKPEVNQPPMGIITMALAGSILGFLIFNFYPARILAGTSGAWFMGFIIAVLAIFAGAKIATALLVVSVPVIDAFWVIGERLRSGNSIFKGGDKKHLHSKLLKLGWPPRKIVLFFYAVTLFIVLVALNTRAIGKLVTIISVAAIMTAALIFINKKISRRNTA